MISYLRTRKKLILLKGKHQVTGYPKKGVSTKGRFLGPICSVFIRIWLITYSMKFMRVFAEVTAGVDHWLTEQCHKDTSGPICKVILFGM